MLSNGINITTTYLHAISTFNDTTKTLDIYIPCAVKTQDTGQANKHKMQNYTYNTIIHKCFMEVILWLLHST